MHRKDTQFYTSPQPLLRESTIIPSKQGRIYLHKNHGKNEKTENIEFARYLADKHDYEILLFPKDSINTNADSFNITLMQTQEYKKNTTPSVNAIDSALRKGFKQANNVVLRINSDISLGDLRDAIIGRIKRLRSSLQLTLIINGKERIYTYNEIASDSFIIKLEEFE